MSLRTGAPPGMSWSDWETAWLNAVRIQDMPDLGAVTSDSSFVGEHAGSGRFSATALATYIRHVMADVYNIKDYGAGVGGDDAAAFRACVGSNRIIFCPPGTYTFRSFASLPDGGYSFVPTPMVLFAGVVNCTIIADGCTFLIDNAVTFPDAARANAGGAHVGFHANCKNITWRGGTLVGNTTNAGSAVNSGMWFENVTALTIDGVSFAGDIKDGLITGVYGFECNFRNWTCYTGSGNGFDLAWMENLLIENCRLYGGAAYGEIASAGCKIFSDAPTQGFNTPGSLPPLGAVVTNPNGTTRNLRGSQSNNIIIRGNLFSGWFGGIALDGIDGARVEGNTVRDGIYATFPNSTGISIVESSTTTSSSLFTRGITLIDNDVYSNQGPGVLLSGTRLTAIRIAYNRIYDNAYAYGIATVFSNPSGKVFIEFNDFAQRAAGAPVQGAPIQAGLVDIFLAAGGSYQNAAAMLENGMYLRFLDHEGAAGSLIAQPDDNLVFSSTGGSGARRPIFGVQMHSDTSSFNPLVPVAITAPTADPFAITVPNGVSGRLVQTVTGTRGWQIGPQADGRYVLADITASRNVFIIDATQNVAFTAGIGVHGATPQPQLNVTGSRGGNAALASLLTALVAYGLITDGTTP